MRAVRPVAIALAALLAALSGCGEEDGNAGTGGTTGAGGTTSLPELGKADRAKIGYAENLLQKVEDDEWTLGEGLVATLQAFAGERKEADVLRYPELDTYEGTGVFSLAREYLDDGSDPDAQAEIARLVGSLEFSNDELEEMAGLSPSPALLTPKDAVEICLEFFEGVGDFPPGVGLCLEVESVTIDGNEHRIFFPADSLPSAGWDETFINMAVDTLLDSIPVYDAIGDVPAINVVFSVADVENLWGRSFPSGTGECSIALFTGVQSEPQDRFQQLLAHEIAHCFQGETWPNQHTPGYAFIKWHYEGGAEYWSNLVYPEVNLEWGYLPSLERWELVTPLHNRSYENFIFFQYLGSTIGNEGIAELISGLPDTPSAGVVEQREMTSDFRDMERIFHEFVQALTDGAVQDTSGAQIPFTASAYEIDLFGPASTLLEVPLLFPFGTYRFLLSADEDEQDELVFRETGTMTSSARRSTDGVSSGVQGVVTESLVVPGTWESALPSELPEEQCDGAARMIVATTTKSPTQDSGGQLSGASFELDVPSVDTIECCLHGQWLMNNQDLAAADTEGLGLTTTYSGQLTADYRPDGTVLFLWGGLTRVIEDSGGASMAVLSGGGAQFYEVPSEGIVTYGPPELTVSVEEAAPSGQTASFVAVLDTALGDLQSTQFYECGEESLVTVIRGGDEIGWQRITPE